MLSNAVLHWVPEPSRTAAALHAALRPGGRLVAELGRRQHRHTHQRHPRPTRRGASAADCLALVLPYGHPTPLAGGDGLASWVRMFATALLTGVTHVDAFLNALEQQLRPVLYRDGSWWADYRRLRVVAVRRS